MQGTSTRMMAVENRIPNPSEIAIGMMYCACSDVSKMIGTSPPKVVSVVSMIGLNLTQSSIQYGVVGWIPAAVAVGIVDHD
jgi:hypothetical protein